MGFHLIQRPGTGLDIAHLAVYLASDESAWVTGPEHLDRRRGHGRLPLISPDRTAVGLGESDAQEGWQYESDDASPPWRRTWCTRSPRNSSPRGKNRGSGDIPPPGPTSSFAIQAPTPSG